MELSPESRFKLWASGVIVAYAPAYSDGSQLKNCVRSTVYQYKLSKLRVQSLCCALWNQKKGKVLYFWTVTIPKPIPEITLTRAWNRFLNQTLKYCLQ